MVDRLLAGGWRCRVRPRAAFEPIDAFGQRLHRRPRFPARQAHERDLEHEPGIGGVGAAHVDHGLPERLERADEHRRPDLLAERPERLLVVAGQVDPHPARARR